MIGFRSSVWTLTLTHTLIAVPVESLVVSLNATQLQLAKKVQKSEAEKARRLQVKTCIENIQVRKPWRNPPYLHVI